MEVTTETTYVIRLSRLDAAKTLVDPKELQTRLRAVLTGTEAPIEGETVKPVLSAGPVRKTALDELPHTRKVMKALKQSGKRIPCQVCGKSLKPTGIGPHMAAHKRDSQRSAEGTMTIDDRAAYEIQALGINAH